MPFDPTLAETYYEKWQEYMGQSFEDAKTIFKLQKEKEIEYRLRLEYKEYLDKYRDIVDRLKNWNNHKLGQITKDHTFTVAELQWFISKNILEKPKE